MGYIAPTNILTLWPLLWAGWCTLMGEEWYSGSNRNDNVDLIDAHVLGFTMNHSKMEIAEQYQAFSTPSRTT